MEDSIKNRLTIEINKSYYTAKRYKQNSTFAILYHEKELQVQTLGKIVRISDQLIKMNENIYFIFFKFTNHEQAFKASENLLFDLDNYFNNTSSCIGIDSFDINQSPTIVINRLLQILDEIKKNSFVRVDDENILNELV